MKDCLVPDNGNNEDGPVIIIDHDGNYYHYNRPWWQSLSWQQPPASASPPDNQGNRAASSSKSRNYCRTVDVATIDVVHSKDAVIHLFQIEMKCVGISNNPGTRLCGGSSKKNVIFWGVPYWPPSWWWCPPWACPPPQSPCWWRRCRSGSRQGTRGRPLEFTMMVVWRKKQTLINLHYMGCANLIRFVG